MNYNSARGGKTGKRHTNDNPDMCGCLVAQRGRVIRVQKNVALAVNRCLKRKPECLIFVFEKDGHLQLPHFDVLSSIRSRIRGPHGLRHDSTTVHDATVEYPTRRRIGKRSGNIGRDGMDEEEIAPP